MKKAAVLVVEDEVPIRRTLEVVLGREGYKILLAANGKEALARVEQQLPDLIVLDMLMPEMDGFVFLEKMSNVSRANDIPVIVYTNLNYVDIESKLKDYNIFQYHMKAQTSIDELLHSINTAVLRK